tara:strand:+ start:4135 stop:4716 length:582 start_codon:yes stop_codon:yes gene_type:complete
MAIQRIDNPRTETYKKLKDKILGQFFPWSWGEKTITTDWQSPDYVDDTVVGQHEDFGFYSHGFLMRPVKNTDVTNCYPTVSSPFIKEAHDLVTEILDYNKVKYNLIFRMAANCIHTTQHRRYSPLHEDHPWNHTNLLIYLTDTYNGDTVVENKEKDQFEQYFGREDEAILFRGVHCHRPPAFNRRIVFIATFL